MLLHGLCMLLQGLCMLLHGLCMLLHGLGAGGLHGLHAAAWTATAPKFSRAVLGAAAWADKSFMRAAGCTMWRDNTHLATSMALGLARWCCSCSTARAGSAALDANERELRGG